MDWVLGRVVEQSHFVTFVGNTEITDLAFADDAQGDEVLGPQGILAKDQG